jgi:hypothetical protein
MGLLCLSAAVLSPTPVLAWNLPAKHINALRFEKDGAIHFTLFDAGSAGVEFFCKDTGSDRQWLVITACPSVDAGCLSSANRMASMLLAAKVSGKMVHVQRAACEVTEVALKP